MPAILEDDAWSTWLGEGEATPAMAKAVLKTMEGVNWQAAPEPKEPRPASPDDVRGGNPRRNEGRVLGHTSLSWKINSTM